MSRRKRRRKAKAAGGGHLWAKLSIGGIIALVVVFAGVYSAVRGYLHSDGFRKFLSGKVSDAAEVEGEFSKFRWDGFAVDCDSFEAVGEGAIQGLRLDGMHTEVGLGGLRRGVWEIQGSRFQRVEVALDMRKAAREAGEEKEGRRDSGGGDGGGGKSGPGVAWLPRKVEVQGLDIGEAVVMAETDEGRISAEGMRVRVEPAAGKNVYEGVVSGGRVALPFGLVPELRLRRAEVRYRDGDVFLNELDAEVFRNGMVEAAGEWDGRAEAFSLEGSVSGVACDEVFSEDWAKRMTGVISMDFAMNDYGGSEVAAGEMRIANGTLTALPVLDALAAYADTQRFRSLNLSEARTKWRWREGELRLSDLVLASKGLIRLEGTLVIRGENLDGRFRLGLIPGALASIPGAETVVFRRGERGLMWTPLRITGTLDDPEEDLTGRLIDAAGLRMFEIIPETGEKAIKFTRKVMGDAPAKVVDEGAKILEEGGEVLDDVGSIIDGFFGGGGGGD